MEKIISGKVREVYDVGQNRLVIVATDRISAFDVILNSTIKGKGVALTLLSNFWFDFTRNMVPNHILSTELSDMPAPFCQKADWYKNRTVLVKKLNMLPYEFIVRGYMFGSVWKEYAAATGTYCKETIDGEYQLAEKLSTPIITPSAKNCAGHDENITRERLRRELGTKEADKIYEICLCLYKACSEYALKKGIIIADTKFEFGYDETGALTLGDEIFTSDSSRFWAAEEYQVGVSPKCFDKQFVRDWLIEHKLNGVEPGPELPDEIAQATAALYQECCRRIIGTTACS